MLKSGPRDFLTYSVKWSYLSFSLKNQSSLCKINISCVLGVVSGPGKTTLPMYEKEKGGKRRTMWFNRFIDYMLIDNILEWWGMKKIESKLIQLQIIDSHRDFNTIYSVKINYRGPTSAYAQNPFNLQLQWMRFNWNSYRSTSGCALCITMWKWMKVNVHCTM